MLSNYSHLAKDCFPISESKHVININIILPYSSSYREYLIKDIRSNVPNIHINVNIKHINFCFHIQRSTYTIGSYIVVNPSGQNWADIAFIASTLHANNLFEVGDNYEENCFLILPYIEAYGTFIGIINFLKFDYTSSQVILHLHLKPISRENSLDSIDWLL